MYESPIQIMYDEFYKTVSDQLDHKIFQTVANANITVDRDELIKALQYDRNQYAKGYSDGCLDGKRYAWEWISVEERLPEFDQKVLVWVKNKDPNGSFNKDGVYVGRLEDKVPQNDPDGKHNFWGLPGYDSEWTVYSWCYFSEPDVLYWMPLPEPPEEVERDGRNESV